LAIEKWAEILLDVDFSAFALEIEMGINYRTKDPNRYGEPEPLIRFEFKTVNRDEPEIETSVFHCPFIPKSIETEKEAIRFVFDHVREILMHEAAELFFYKGYRYSDPHWNKENNSTVGIVWQLPEVEEWNKRV